MGQLLAATRRPPHRQPASWPTPGGPPPSFRLCRVCFLFRFLPPPANQRPRSASGASADSGDYAANRSASVTIAQTRHHLRAGDIASNLPTSTRAQVLIEIRALTRALSAKLRPSGGILASPRPGEPGCGWRLLPSGAVAPPRVLTAEAAHTPEDAGAQHLCSRPMSRLQLAGRRTCKRAAGSSTSPGFCSGWARGPRPVRVLPASASAA